MAHEGAAALETGYLAKENDGNERYESKVGAVK
jgi:hypothetical protein